MRTLESSHRDYLQKLLKVYNPVKYTNDETCEILFCITQDRYPYWHQLLICLLPS